MNYATYISNHVIQRLLKKLYFTPEVELLKSGILSNIKMDSKQLNVLLADDDTDDRIFFKQILEQLPLATHLTTVLDGKQLMDYLVENTEQLPDVLFLDLSMPQKTGFECLAEIKENEKWKDIPVVILSTFYQRDIVYEQNIILTLSRIGAEDYIRKPGDFLQLKEIIHQALIRVSEKRSLSEQGGNLYAVK
ncbi:MAG: response regulator [Flavobacteriales bacterium]